MSRLRPFTQEDAARLRTVLDRRGLDGEAPYGERLERLADLVTEQEPE